MFARWAGPTGAGKEKNALAPELALKLGQAAGVTFRNGGEHRVLLGKDPRRSSYLLESALMTGLISAGMYVILTGPIPVSGIAALTPSLRADLGIMISGSHEPYEQNGILLFGPDGSRLVKEREDEIDRLLGSDISNISKRLAKSGDLGHAKRIDGVRDRYVELAKKTIPKGTSFKGIRVVVDCANGAAYEVAPSVLRELDAEVVTIGVAPDGYNINRDCGVHMPHVLQKMVHERRADLGIALDGDGDRVVLVDEKVRVIDPRHVLSIIEAFWRDAGLLVPAVYSEDPHTLFSAMSASAATLGGDSDGHVIMTEYASVGDGLVAALQVLAYAHARRSKVSELVDAVVAGSGE